MENTRAKRILILGLPGAGKSTLARKLSSRYSIPHVEADRFFNCDTEVFLTNISRAIEAEEFVIEGHFKTLKPLFDERITEVIWLDPGFARVVSRLLRREFATGGMRQIFKRHGTTRFFLKNWRALHRFQRAAFADFSERQVVVRKL